MSSYLADRVAQTPNIEILLNTEVRRMRGDGHLDEVELFNNKTGETRRLKVTAVFSFIGAVPRTEWLPPEIEKDERGFIRTGPSLRQSSRWNSRRQPLSVGDIACGCVCCRRRAIWIGQASCLCSRRRFDGRAIRACVFG